MHNQRLPNCSKQLHRQSQNIIKVEDHTASKPLFNQFRFYHFTKSKISILSFIFLDYFIGFSFVFNHFCMGLRTLHSLNFQKCSTLNHSKQKEDCISLYCWVRLFSLISSKLTIYSLGSFG